MHNNKIESKIIAALKNSGAQSLHGLIYTLADNLPPRQFDNFRQRAKRAAYNLVAQGQAEITEEKIKGRTTYKIILI